MSKEIWKDINGYEGFYQVSNLGNVKSLLRIIKRKNGVNNTVKERILKKGIGSNGYEIVVLIDKYKNKKSFRVHQLVAIGFLNHTPNYYKTVVDHINNIKTDNRLENIQIISNRENCSKDKKNGTSKYIGVSWSKVVKLWQASIYCNGKNIHLGYYETEYEASQAYTEYKYVLC